MQRPKCTVSGTRKNVIDLSSWIEHSDVVGVGFAPWSRADHRARQGLDDCRTEFSVVGLSQVRETNTFEGIPITEDGSQRRSGVWVIDLETGETVALLRFSDAVEEIFAVKVLPGLRFPSLLEPGHPLIGTSYVLPDDALKEVARPSAAPAASR